MKVVKGWEKKSSELRNRMFEIRNPKSEIGSAKPEVDRRTPKSNVLDPNCMAEVGNKKSKDKSQKIKSRQTEIKLQTPKLSRYKCQSINSRLPYEFCFHRLLFSHGRNNIGTDRLLLTFEN